jgi:iron complex transport system substrate-binding protein
MKRIIPIFLILTLFFGCAPKQAAAPERVVSMMASLSELWLLAGGELTGVTEDTLTRKIVSDTACIGTVQHLNFEAILGLSPTLVIGSPDLAQHCDAKELLDYAGIPCELFHVDNFSDYLKTLKYFTALTGRDDLYDKNGLQIEAKINSCIESVPDTRPTVLLLRATSSAVKALDSNHMTAQMLDDLGAVNIAESSILDELSLEKILELDPDFILVVPTGGTRGAESAVKKQLASSPAWSSLNAVKNDRFIMLDRDLFHYKPNARWGEAYETLAKILYKN